MENGENMIYLQPKEKLNIIQGTSIYVEDICEIIGEAKLIEKVKNIEILQGTYEKTVFVVSLVMVLDKIRNSFPELYIYVLNEKDILIQVEETKNIKTTIFEKIKIVLVCLLLLIGAGVTMMNFHADVNMVEAQKNFYKMVTGKNVEKPLWIAIPYSLGIGIGMMVFFNHLSPKKRKTDQPSPLDLEMDSYQNNIDDFMRNNKKESKN
ncbi:stage V sporulation protein AA [Irregularibacter muris]|uniref:Stage V sporulation protein AA n=1 Tax=Irregularibacter muris TaxID=1796619 RepID=A0AAE3L381_9FIRM|nr:stage V sporulation protein AA [Irregularibacter muris]MCR1897798.1 stage V sporulation protein AA [Irregularibacter muris]